MVYTTNMNSTTTTVNQKYQIVIPKEIRKQFPIKPNEKVILRINEEGYLIIEKVPTILDLQGSYTFPKDYLKNERTSWND